MKYTSFNYLLEEITNREVPLAETILELLHPNRDRARSIFVSQVRNALKEFEKHWPLVMQKIGASVDYKFVDNFEGYRLGNISEKNLELIPLAIANVQASRLSKAVTKNNYYYYPETHSTSATGLITYYAKYPLYFENDENGYFTDDSGVYLLEERESAMFVDQLALELLKFLQNTRNTVNPSFGMQFFDFSQRINELSDIVNKNNAYSSVMYRTWAN